VNVVTGYGHEVGAPATEHPKVAKIAFTGGEGTGQRIYQNAARDFKHVTLELGGKSANIVFEDANLDNAVKGAISGIFAASGQTCVAAGSRLLVHDSIYDEFIDRLIAFAKTAKIGNPKYESTQVGPVTTSQQYKKILEYIDIAKSENAVCRLGGSAVEVDGCEGGLFVEPTIFTEVNNNMRIAQSPRKRKPFCISWSNAIRPSSTGMPASRSSKNCCAIRRSSSSQRAVRNPLASSTSLTKPNWKPRSTLYAISWALLHGACRCRNAPYPRRISGGALEIGAAKFSHPVKNTDANLGLCLLIFEVARLELGPDDGLPTADLRLNAAALIVAR